MSGVTLRDLSSLFTAWTEAAAAANADRPERTIDITRGDLPKWNHEKDHFTTFERRVVMWMRSHDIEHLLEKYPESHETSLHKKAMLVITNQLKEDDAKTVHHIAHLCDVWAFLTGKYHPSDEADRARLWQRFDTITKGNRPVKNYHSDIISLVAQLTALGQPPPDYLVRMRMFKCGPEFDTIKFDLEDKPHLSPAAIMAKYVAHEERHGLRAAGGPGAPAGGQGPGGRRGGHPRRPGGQQADAQQAALAVGKKKWLTPEDGCSNCGAKGHFKRDCPKLDPAVRAHLNKEYNDRKAAREAAKQARGNRS